MLTQSRERFSKVRPKTKVAGGDINGKDGLVNGCSGRTAVNPARL